MSTRLMIMTVFVSMLLTGSPRASAQGRDLVRAVSVNGQCLKMVPADRGAIVVTADIQDKDLQQAIKKSTQSYEAVRGAVQKLGLKDAQLTTSEYNVQEVRDWEKDRSVFKGYRARMGLQVATSEISRLGEVIAIAAKLGVRDVGALRTYLSEEKTKRERESCLEMAITNAQSKAARMAKAASAKLGRVLTMTEEGAEAPNPPIMHMKSANVEMEASADMAPPSVDASSERISVNVNVTYGLE